MWQAYFVLSSMRKDKVTTNYRIDITYKIKNKGEKNLFIIAAAINRKEIK